MRDPYDVLGVGRKATADELKKAYRKLAKKLHPDANKTDANAATRFAELNGAYEILGDETKRGQFDRGEIDAEGKPRFHGFEGAHPGAGARGFGGGPGGFSGFESFSFRPEGVRRPGGRGPAGGPAGGMDDFLGDILGAMGGRAAGGQERGFHPGFGAASGRGDDVNAQVTVTLAEAAKGAKKRVSLPTGREVEVAIPAGIASGQTVRLRGLGHPGPLRQGAPGDALVTVEVAPHPTLKPDGENLRTEVAVPLADAVLGGKVRVETLEGAVDLSVPPMSSSGRTFRIRGRGLPKAGGGVGDLFVSLKIMLPETADPELDAVMRKWRARAE
ncbi:DnaJ C-terminal domain-containing protein [Blastochloris viridis]|uniref:Curved DNA-binding protein n=1 Tax=Blastochloris viridis TaxID=1079 RepID=A0A0H5BDT3_BLAVI|nr:DnaJ C-terminal domain-containing protein [Blastochloris viridis]ALK09733.1 Curved DNA-binding protein [Blastochloris viridis]BAS00373.1 DnaJ-class molecular chaperone CbpA [Blastochloris viridis]CUU42396.1 Curved DNA-binding protein [Blastochloris viridis]